MKCSSYRIHRISEDSDVQPGQRIEYIVRLADGNHFIWVEVEETWPDQALIYGDLFSVSEASFKTGQRVLGTLLGRNEQDVRGWLLTFND